MLRDSIKDYFLDKPGTFEDQDRSRITLNLASEKVVEIYQDYIDFKIDVKEADNLVRKLKKIKPLEREGHFQWNQVSTSDISFNEICDIIDESYESVINTLPKDEQEEILDLEW